MNAKVMGSAWRHTCFPMMILAWLLKSFRSCGLLSAGMVMMSRKEVCDNVTRHFDKDTVTPTHPTKES